MENSFDYISIKDYKLTEEVDCAINASGIIYDLADIMPKIWTVAHTYSLGTDWVNKHPITQAFIHKLATVSGVETGSNDPCKWFDLIRDTLRYVYADEWRISKGRVEMADGQFQY